MNRSNIEHIIHIKSDIRKYHIPIVRPLDLPGHIFHPDFDVEVVYMDMLIGIIRYGYGIRSKTLIIGDE